MSLLLLALLLQSQPPSQTPVPRPPVTAPRPTTAPPEGGRGLDPSAYGMNVGLMVSGRVLLDGITPPPEPVPVEYSCRREAATVWTNTKGAFQVYAGEQYSGSRQATGAMPRLDGCQISVQIPGFERISKNLSGARTPRDLDLGVLVLRAWGRPQGSAMSARSAAAPDAARREYIRALEALGQRKFDEARSNLSRALSLFPDYAAAYYSLGQLEDRLGHREAARSNFERAAAADP